MASGKHGRLFTEADVRLLMRFAHIDGWKQARGGEVPSEVGVEWDPADAFRRYEECRNRLTFPPDEPLFLLRGQDDQAVDTLIDYNHNVLHRSPAAHVASVRAAIRNFNEWQTAHPDRVKVAD